MFLGFESTGFSGIMEGPDDRAVMAGMSDLILDWEIVVYSATHELITRIADAPSNTMFKGTLDKAFQVDRTLIGSDTVGTNVTIGLGELTINNYESDYDFLAGAVTPLGQRVVIRCGDRRRPYSEWHLVLDGYMTSLAPTRDGVTFELRDGGYLLDVPTSPNLYGGAGDTDGGSDLAGKNKPRVFGWVLEWTAPLVIATSRAFQLNDGPIHSVQECRVLGVEQVFDGDYASVAAMNAATFTSPGVGYYKTCLAEGWGRVAVANDSEVNNVTWDFAGDATGSVFVETAADIVQRIIETSVGLGADSIAPETFAALNAAQPAPLGYGISAGNTESASTTIAAIMGSIGGWCGSRRSGKFEVRRFEVPSGIPVGSYDKSNLTDISLVALPAALMPPAWRVKVGYQRIWTTGQENLAGSVSEDYVSFLSEELRFASDEDVQIKNDFPPGHDMIIDQVYFRDESDAEDEATRLLALWGTTRLLYVLPLTEKLYIHELGNVVSIQFDDRFDLESPKLATVVEINEDDSQGITLTVFA